MIGDKILPNARKTGSPPIGNGVTGSGIAGAIKVL
jgi:hypothetical protein